MSTALRPTPVKAPEIGALRAARIGSNNPSHVIVMLGEAVDRPMTWRRQLMS